jgi:enoyl-CoA hydratase/carnithine racemase
VSDDILAERRGSVLWITFNRPQARNAMKLAMYERLAALCDEIDADDGLRAVVLTGAGDQAFVSGTDISEFDAFREPEDALRYEHTLALTLDRLEAVRIPLIAAVRGACTGGGMAIAATCDLRIATPGSRFGFPIARTLGNCLSIANYARLANIVGETAVKEMVYLSSLIDARRAYELRFLNEVLHDEDGLPGRAAEIAETIAGNAPLTIRATKEALRRIARDGRDADDRDLIVGCYMSSDFREGMTAFFEKRRANWTGR